ncbi:MAG: hypothetical protein K8T25_00260 [Planctomycetia bacterium]|nr:hypothetical protein [Planctomycetia bacterium]
MAASSRTLRYLFLAPTILLIATAGRIHAAEPQPPTNPAAAAKPPVNVTLSKETTRITEPLTAEGYPDYVEYLNRQLSQGVTPQNNAVVLLWRVVGPKEVPATVRAEYFHRLGVAVPPEKGNYLLDFDDYVKSQQLGNNIKYSELIDQETDGYSRPWREKQFPLLASWLAASERPLNLATQLIERPRYYEPQVTNAKSFRMIAAFLPSAQASRMIGRALCVRAMLRLGHHDVEGAWADLLATRRLARLVGKGTWLIDGLVAIALDTLASNGETSLVHYGNLTLEQSKRFRRQLAAAEPALDFTGRLDNSERLMMLDSVCDLTRAGTFGSTSPLDGLGYNPFQAAGSSVGSAVNIATDWNLVLIANNRFFDQMIAAARIKDSKARKAALASTDARIKQLSECVRTTAPTAVFLPLTGKPGRELFSRYMSGLTISLLMPGLTVALSAEDRDTTFFRRTEILLALGAYRTDHNEYPQRLDQLVPGYLSKLPRDAFTDAEFRYERTKDGFRIYSVGSNGEDEGGRGYNDEPAGDDWLLEMPPREPKGSR